MQQLRSYKGASILYTVKTVHPKVVYYLLFVVVAECNRDTKNCTALHCTRHGINFDEFLSVH